MAGLAVFALGFVVCGAAGMLLAGVHVTPAPVPAGTIYIAGLEIMALGYLIVRELPGEVALRVALYLVYTYVALGSLLLAISRFVPFISAFVGLETVSSAQAATWLVVAGVASANLALLYRRFGLTWRPRPAESTRPATTRSAST